MNELFEASATVVPFDVFRVPYRVVDRPPPRVARLAGGLVHAAWTAGERALYWAAPDGPRAEYRLRGITLFVAALGDADVELLLARDDAGWARAEPVLAADGSTRTSVWRSAGGDVFFPFDLSAAVTALWSEAYVGGEGRPSVKRVAMRVYYRLKPFLPRRLQLLLRRGYTRVQERSEFPRWPLETSLHDFYDLVLGLAAEVAGEPVPTLAAWPSPYAWAFVLTHDVELAIGHENVHLMRDLELRSSLRSSWNFVPLRYETSEALLDELRQTGFEIGVHGLHHDGRDLESRAMLLRRLPRIRAYAERWGAVGFRSPATHRSWELMPLLGFDYDSSSPDTDPFEPQGGGCCSWLPFFNGDLVELPITLPQDHTLFEILGQTDAKAWVDKAEALRARGGMALLITHPDYMIEPARLDLYQRFIEEFAGDDTAWRTLPRDVSAWWRRRAETSIRRGEGGWQIDGPASGDARIELVG